MSANGGVASPPADELQHYGVKGMRWGVRRERPSGGGGGVSESVKKAAITAGAVGLTAAGAVFAKKFISINGSRKMIEGSLAATKVWSSTSRPAIGAARRALPAASRRALPAAGSTAGKSVARRSGQAVTRRAGQSVIPVKTARAIPRNDVALRTGGSNARRLIIGGAAAAGAAGAGGAAANSRSKKNRNSSR